MLSSTRRIRGAVVVVVDGGLGLELGSGLGAGLGSEGVSLPGAGARESEMLVFRARVGKLVVSFGKGWFFRSSARIREMYFLSL